MDMNLALIYCPFPDLASARAAVTSLLEERLIACANLLPDMESHYRWEGKATMAQEIVVIAKMPVELAANAASRLSELHPYDLPAILTLPTQANTAFAKWVAAETAE